MGAQLSALKKDIDSILPKGPDRVLRTLHVVGHYSIIPAIYLVGLVQAGEFTWNPLSLLEKVFVA
jgi:uncharacterized membrane protein